MRVVLKEPSLYWTKSGGKRCSCSLCPPDHGVIPSNISSAPPCDLGDGGTVLLLRLPRPTAARGRGNYPPFGSSKLVRTNAAPHTHLALLEPVPLRTHCTVIEPKLSQYSLILLCFPLAAKTAVRPRSSSSLR
jgi:hypothetical protein